MSRARKVAAIVVAAGRGERATSDKLSPPKQYRPILGVPVMQRTIKALLDIDAIDFVLPVIHHDHALL